MREGKHIEIEELKILENRLLLFKLSYSREIKKFFSSNYFYVRYDKDIHNVSTSILEIPVISNIITVAWAVGADIYVEQLDKTYLKSLDDIKAVMRRWYPSFCFSTEIYAEKIVTNKFSNEAYGLLFSGGIDSMTSYLVHRNRRPHLIMVWGADIPVDREKFWTEVRNVYQEFAEQENMAIDFVKTNMRQFINEQLLNAEFGRKMRGFSWWGGIHHGIGLVGLCAPLTVESIGTLLIAASHTEEFKQPWGSHPLIDGKISWADVRVVHDGYELSRQEKIRRILKGYMRNEKHNPYLRVCFSQFRDFNCGKCEKCSRAITGLVLEGIDPNKCGFNLATDFFGFLRQKLVEGEFFSSEDEVFMWKDIQRHIPEEICHNLHDSKQFFKWFRDFDISRKSRKRLVRWRSTLLRIYDRLPRNVHDVILEGYYRVAVSR